LIAAIISHMHAGEKQASGFSDERGR